MSEQSGLTAQQEASLADLLAILRLEPLGSAQIRIDGVDGEEAVAVSSGAADVFIGQSIKQPHNRVFGGQVLAQALMATSLTVRDEHEGRLPHSLHAYFMRPGDDTLPIRFAVERMRDGRSFSTRRVHAIQHGKPILSLTASFQDPAGGLDHHAEMPEVTAPAELPSLSDLFATIDHPRAQHLAARPADHRYVEGHIAFEPSAEPTAVQHVWMRAIGEIDDDPYVRAAVLAYMSDYSLLEPVLRRHGRTWTDRAMSVASLDHTMWFHRPFDPSAWLLYAQESPSAQGGRGLGIGKVFSEDGTLVATIAQEGMVRVPAGSDGA